jgi:hypothetical protein
MNKNARQKVSKTRIPPLSKVLDKVLYGIARDMKSIHGWNTQELLEKTGCYIPDEQCL